MKKNEIVNVALLGAGYIADYHAKVLQQIPGIRIVAICDLDKAQADRVARRYSIPFSFTSLDALLDYTPIDVIHNLLPPNVHYDTTHRILEAGIHVFTEKPMCLTNQESEKLVSLAEGKRLKLGINHSFLFYPVYEKLRQCLQKNELGPLDHLNLTFHRELDQLRHGPYNAWMLREPQNIILELGPHLCALLADMIEKPKLYSVQTSNPRELPNKQTFFQRWLATFYQGNSCAEVRLSCSPGQEERTIEVRGLYGSARVDFEANTFIKHQHKKASLDFDRYDDTMQEAKNLQKQAKQTLKDYIFAKLKLSKKHSPYYWSMYQSILTFYSHFDGELDSRHSPYFGQKVVDLCNQIASKAELPAYIPVTPPKYTNSIPPRILVLGASGFIGQALTRQLLACDHPVRILVRSPSKIPVDLYHEKLQIMTGDLFNKDDIDKAVEGMDFVFHLARAHANTWDEYKKYDIDVTEEIAKACLKHNVKRLLYTGTIDSYYAGNKNDIITEETPLDPRIHRRNLYAQAKAASETLLMDMFHTKKLPVVIFRPGIVIGKGSSPFHWGVGFWHYNGAYCQFWGDGNNPLPIVLADDVASAMINAMTIKDIEGESYNLIDNECITAEEYVKELEKALGAKIQTEKNPIWKFYGFDMFKWLIKCFIRHPNRVRPSYHDWKSRTQLARFDCSKAINQLNWRPTGYKENIIDKGIFQPARDWLG